MRDRAKVTSVVHPNVVPISLTRDAEVEIDALVPLSVIIRIQLPPTLYELPRFRTSLLVIKIDGIFDRALITYKRGDYNHLMASVGGLIALLCPIIILAVAWVLMAVYTITDHPEHRRRFLNRKRITWLVVEALGLALIVLDYHGIVAII